MGLFKNNMLQPQPRVNAQQAMAQLQNNPIGTLRKFGLNVPADMTDPKQMVQHLVQTGQIPQVKLQQVTQMMGQAMGQMKR